MKRFCRDSPAERLGYQKDGIMDIKKHKWFQGFDWDGLLERSLAPPLVPSVQSASDASNFDQVKSVIKFECQRTDRIYCTCFGYYTVQLYNCTVKQSRIGCTNV